MSRIAWSFLAVQLESFIARELVVLPDIGSGVVGVWLEWERDFEALTVRLGIWLALGQTRRWPRGELRVCHVERAGAVGHLYD